MIIGLYDADMSKYIHVPFNLELMKISSYYKNKREIVSLSPSFSPQMYNKYFYRKDYYDGDFPKEIFSSGNVEHGGRAFNQNTYVPLDEVIERQKPDKYIYEVFSNSFGTNKTNSAFFKAMMNAEHFRLSLDGKTIWKDFERQLNMTPSTRTLFLHDYNLNSIENSDIIIKEIMKRMSKYDRSLANKFPIQANNSEELLKWTGLTPSQGYFLLQYNGIMEDELLDEFIQKQKHTSISDQLEYVVTRNYNSEEDFIQNGLPILFKQIAYLRGEKQKVKLVYDENFFTDKRWEKLIRFFQSYLNSTVSLNPQVFNRVIKYDSLYSYAFNLKENPKFKAHVFNKQDARDLFQFVRVHNYELFKDFYECHTVKLKEGKFKNE